MQPLYGPSDPSASQPHSRPSDLWILAHPGLPDPSLSLSVPFRLPDPSVSLPAPFWPSLSYKHSLGYQVSWSLIWPLSGLWDPFGPSFWTILVLCFSSLGSCPGHLQVPIQTCTLFPAPCWGVGPLWSHYALWAALCLRPLAGPLDICGPSLPWPLSGPLDPCGHSIPWLGAFLPGCAPLNFTLHKVTHKAVGADTIHSPILTFPGVGHVWHFMKTALPQAAPLC